jgi:hypothetical protein
LDLVISAEGAGEMLDDFADLPVVHDPMRTYQRRVLAPRDCHGTRRASRFYSRAMRPT